METERLVIHDILAELYPGIPLYYGPTTETILSYPCVIYELDGLDSVHANNKPYQVGLEFIITLIQLTPPDIDIRPMMDISGVDFQTTFTTKSLMHSVFKKQALGT